MVEQALAGNESGRREIKMIMFERMREFEDVFPELYQQAFGGCPLHQVNLAWIDGKDLSAAHCIVRKIYQLSTFSLPDQYDLKIVMTMQVMKIVWIRIIERFNDQ